MKYVCVSLIMLMLTAGCAEKPYRKPTFPVIGKVVVDGAAPGSEIQIGCHPTGPMDTDHPTFSQSATDADGNFSISTYISGDGVPAGEYTLTFSWQEFNVISRNYSGPDKLNGRYSDPAKSEIKITVAEGKQLDLKTIELTTK